MTTTDTPRTDAYNNSLGVVPADFARQLERELNELWSRFDKQMEAEAEVERLTEQLESTKLLALKFWKVLEENGFKMELPK